MNNARLTLLQNICETQPLLRATLADYHRTAIRHRLAKATVVILDGQDTDRLLAAATFKQPEHAAAFAERATLSDPLNVVVILNHLGETVAVAARDQHLTRKAATTAEWLWRASHPIPRGKSRPETNQPTFPF